jgi:phosphoenolpyruvate carboxykinase (GTP)
VQWIARRCEGTASGADTPLGIMPRFEDLTWTGLESKLTPAQFAELARVDRAAWKEELASHDELFGKLGARLPEALETRRGRMHQKLAA